MTITYNPEKGVYETVFNGKHIVGSTRMAVISAALKSLVWPK